MVFGTEKFLAWVKEQHPNLHRWDLKNLNQDPSIYLVDAEDQNCWGNCFIEKFEAIFRNEVGGYINGGVEWPKDITVELFQSWFTFEYTEAVYDLSKENIEVSEEWVNT